MKVHSKAFKAKNQVGMKEANTPTTEAQCGVLSLGVELKFQCICITGALPQGWRTPNRI